MVVTVTELCDECRIQLMELMLRKTLSEKLNSGLGNLIDKRGSEFLYKIDGLRSHEWSSVEV